MWFSAFNVFFSCFFTVFGKELWFLVGWPGGWGGKRIVLVVCDGRVREAWVRRCFVYR